MRIQEWLWVALLSMRTRYCYASERSIHHMAFVWDRHRTLPAGYVGESAAEGAIRETWEEANAEVEVLSPYAHLDIPLIGQTYIIFLAKLKRPNFSRDHQAWYRPLGFTCLHFPSPFACLFVSVLLSRMSMCVWGAAYHD